MGVTGIEGLKTPDTVNRNVFNPEQASSKHNPLLVESEQKQDEQMITPVLEKLKKTAIIFDYRFHFKIHEATGRVMVQVIDQETGEVLNEIPPEKVLDLAARIRELVGLLVDEKV